LLYTIGTGYCRTELNLIFKRVFLQEIEAQVARLVMSTKAQRQFYTERESPSYTGTVLQTLLDKKKPSPESRENRIFKTLWIHLNH